MTTSGWAPTAAILSTLLLATLPARGDTATDLDHLRWKARPVLIFAPTRDDARLKEQQRLFNATEAALSERDMRIVDVVGDTSSQDASLRDRLDVAPDAFAVILIGKDGGEKFRAAHPVPPERLFALIDAMPMRKREVQGRTLP